MPEREPHNPIIAIALGAGAVRAGKGAPDWAIEREAAWLLRMSSPGAPVAKRLARYWDPTMVLIRGIMLEQQLEDGQDGRKNTQRGLFEVYTGAVNDDNATGIEPFRTDRTDTPHGSGRQVFDIVAQNTGMVVRVWRIKEARTDKPGREVRVAIWVDVLGAPTPEEIEEAERISGRRMPRTGQSESRQNAPQPQQAPARTNTPAAPVTTASAPAAQPPAKLAASPLTEEDRIALEAGERASAVAEPPVPGLREQPAPGPELAPPALPDDGIPLGAPGVHNLPPAKLAAYINAEDPPLPSELTSIARQAWRLTNGDDPREGESESAAHEREAHQLVEGLLGYHLNGPGKGGALSYEMIRSRYHAKQVLDHLSRQPSPQSVKAS